MADEYQERLFLEAVQGLLNSGDLGVVQGGVDAKGAHNFQFQYEDINNDFALKISKKIPSEFFQPAMSAFAKVHAYKYINDDTFYDAIRGELKSQGITGEVLKDVISVLDDLRKKYDTEHPDDRENMVGWASNLDDVAKSTQEYSNDQVSDTSKETFSGNNKPFAGVEPNGTRPRPNKI